MVQVKSRIVDFEMFIIRFYWNSDVDLFKQHLKMKKLWCVVCFMMSEKSLLPVVMVKLVSIDLLFIHHYIDFDKDVWANIWALSNHHLFKFFTSLIFSSGKYAASLHQWKELLDTCTSWDLSSLLLRGRNECEQEYSG